jgi:hypothetical protein
METYQYFNFQFFQFFIKITCVEKCITMFTIEIMLQNYKILH